ncbi:MAG TPA: UDP-glucose--hexose-1-phosphate uridylyltransferase [Candidatus Limnocylindrales bacterium]
MTGFRSPSRSTSTDDLLKQPHRRYDPLTDEWLLVSAGRTQRPWLGREEDHAAEERPAYDPTCYLCPGNVRAGGQRNPAYDSTWAFTNDFAALQPTSPLDRFESGLLIAEGEQGTCRVICFSPRHDLTLREMSPPDVRRVIDLWADQSAELGAQFPWVQVFENRGTAMGASNPHPHGQIWAGSALPWKAVREDVAQRRYFEANDRRLLLDYATQERDGPRQVELDEDWLIVVPFWAAWPYETLVVPRRPVGRLPDLDNRQRDRLTRSLIALLGRYDTLFGIPFPYSMGWHQTPFDGVDRPYWQLHAHFYPPLLGETVRKFMVGYELLSELQRDITAEDAAGQLRLAAPAAPAGAATEARARNP